MLRDLLLAGRWLSKTPLFALGVIAILLLGIGANTAVFSLVDAVLLQPLPYPSSESLVRIAEASARRASLGTPASDYLRWRGRSDLFESVVAYGGIWSPLPPWGNPTRSG